MDIFRTATPAYRGTQQPAPRARGAFALLGANTPAYQVAGAANAPAPAKARIAWPWTNITPAYLTAPAAPAGYPPQGCPPETDPAFADDGLCVVDPCAECPTETTQIVIL